LTHLRTLLSSPRVAKLSALLQLEKLWADVPTMVIMRGVRRREGGQEMGLLVVKEGMVVMQWS